jgi:hypothetical protein
VTSTSILSVVSPPAPSRTINAGSEVGFPEYYETTLTRVTPMQRTCVEQCSSPEVGPSRCEIDEFN